MNFFLAKYVWVLTALFLFSGCVSIQQDLAPPAYSADVKSVLSGTAILGHVVTDAEMPEHDLFGITPEMAAFAEQAVKGSYNDFERVKALHVALLSAEKEGGRGIRYSANSTQTPATTFQDRQANCLSFTLLYVALAQHIGLNAQINEVQIPPTWDLRNKNSLLFLRHVNVKVLLRGRNSLQGTTAFDDAIIDLEMDRYKSIYTQYPIPNAIAAAQFYNNRAMELADAGNVKGAFLYLRKAMFKNSYQSYIWNNLASLYRRENLLREAEIAYQYGLEINPNDLTIMTNLAGLYAKLGDTTHAQKYRELVEQHRKINPYYQYTMALSAFDNGDNHNALTYIKRAIAREHKELRFYQLAANIYEKLGDVTAATAMHRRYQRLSDKYHSVPAG